ncbi:unnamed protein product [Ceutorhynchus assimilis]|uniref:Tesmin/TSO1-like CXC domain-containing protein n=1 Tax=Ceutorhynchus assimilis TaxID=467358 RepID=A0A9N9MU64_9CUCU|nr:unnamed protein product [Ceutorhynchus assimilis]
MHDHCTNTPARFGGIEKVFGSDWNSTGVKLYLKVPEISRVSELETEICRAVVWPRPATYGDVCALYGDHILKRYGSGATVVFDGYKHSELTPKGEEQRRRSSGKTSPTLVNLQLDQLTCTAQTNFLGNGENKEILLAMLRPVLEGAGLTVLQASGDADQLIVATALQLSVTQKSVVVTATDTDIFAMLIQRYSSEYDVYMLMPGVSGRSDKVHNIRSVQSSLGAVKNVLLFAHAMTGSDTTSALFGKGKTALLNLLMKNEELMSEVQLFNSQGAEIEALVSLGERTICALYGVLESQTLLGVRHSIFTRPTARKDLTPELKLKLMLPTSGAARYHTLRVYLQVQNWLGHKLDAIQFGWREGFGRLLPVISDDPPAPDSLLKLVRCGCTTGCNQNCGCRRAGMPCKSYCARCEGNCTNNEPVVLDDAETDAVCLV